MDEVVSLFDIVEKALEEGFLGKVIHRPAIFVSTQAVDTWQRHILQLA